jgi:hypothetical protein
MGCELDQLMWAAWERIGAGVLADSNELRVRLARRRSRMFERVPRALCLAVRASDHRITAWTAAICPEDAMERGNERDHEVRLDMRLVSDVCRPVQIAWPGEPTSDVRVYLGCDDSGLKAMRRKGIVRERYVKGLGGRRGNVPLVYTEQPLDANGWAKAAPDPLVGPFWSELVGRVPVDLEQTVVRRPEFGELRGKRRLVGWRWICPGCGKRVRMLYYPIGAMDWAEAHDIKLELEEVERTPRQPGCFACVKCHGVVNFTRTEGAIRKCWNHVVLHCSGGLLYGHEVKRPAWFVAERKKVFVARPKKSPRMDELERLLTETELSLEGIGREMGIRERSVQRVAYDVYRRRGVEGRMGLRRLMQARVRRSA